MINSGGVLGDHESGARRRTARSTRPRGCEQGLCPGRYDDAGNDRDDDGDGDGDGLERLGLADSRAGEKAKTQLGQEVVEEERMRSLQSLSETKGTLAAVDAPSEE